MPNRTARARGARVDPRVPQGRGLQASAEVSAPPRRTPHLARFTPDEWAAVCAHASACGLRPARYVREAALGAALRARRQHGGDAIIRELLRIGNAMEQLAAVARVTGLDAQSVALTAALDAVDAAVRRVE